MTKKLAFAFATCASLALSVVPAAPSLAAGTMTATWNASCSLVTVTANGYGADATTLTLLYGEETTPVSDGSVGVNLASGTATVSLPAAMGNAQSGAVGVVSRRQAGKTVEVDRRYFACPHYRTTAPLPAHTGAVQH